MNFPCSRISDSEWPRPCPVARSTGFLSVSEGTHRIYWEEYGNPDGEPVMTLHGGLGGASSPEMARFCDPDRYRIILFDQRGCGKSLPSVADDDPRPALNGNTTEDMINDVMALRGHLNISGKMHVFGGSWGSTLALAYAIAHPETVETLILRGIFLCRRKDLDFFYQGNAARFQDDPFDTTQPGAYQFYPEAWEAFVNLIPSADRHDMVKAYAKIFNSTPQNAQERAHQDRAAQVWSTWEGATSYLSQSLDKLGQFSDPHFARAFAMIENHYFMNGGFLGGKSGEANRDNNYILENVHRLKGIPVHIVHGRFDVVCPMGQADELVRALHAQGQEVVSISRPPAGHSMFERANAFELIRIMDGLPPMHKASKPDVQTCPIATPALR